MSALPTTSIEVNEQPRTNRKVVSAVSIGLAVFGCSMLVSNMKSTSTETATEVTPAQPVRSLTGYIPSSSAENLIKMAGSPSKSPSSGVHKPTWKPSSKPAEHRGLGSKSFVKEAKEDMKDMKHEIKTDKKEMKGLKSEIKSDKKAIKEEKEAIINEETGRPYGLDEDGTIHSPKLGSKLGQVEGEVVKAEARKDAKDLVKTTDNTPYTVAPRSVPLAKKDKSDTIPYTIAPHSAKNDKNMDRYLKATHGKLTDAQKDIIAEVMASESKEDATLKSFIDQKIIADEELAAATAAYSAAVAQQLEATAKASELETKLAKALDMKDVTRAESSGSSKSSSKSASKDGKAPRELSDKKDAAKTTVPSKKEVKAELKSDKKELSQDTLSKSSKKEIKSEIKSDKKELKAIKEAEINVETGRPYGLDLDGTIHSPKLGSKLGQVEGEVVKAEARKDAKDLVKTTDNIPYTIAPHSAKNDKNMDRYLKATHGKLTDAQKEIIADVMASESKEDATLKSFIDQKIIADEELAAANAAIATATTQEQEASVKVSELEAKLAKALDMKDVTRAESSSKSSSHRQLEGARGKTAPAPKEVVVAKKDTMTPPKKAEAPKEEKDEKKDVEPREEVDGGKPVAKKTAKPTVKPTTPPKPTVPPTTKKPSEKKGIDTEKVEGPKLHPASRMLAEVKKPAAPAPKEVVVAKKDTMTPPKKAEAPKEEKKDVEPREEVDGGKPVAKKTAKPTVKPTTPPKPTVPPTTKKPSEKKGIDTEKVEGPKLHPASRMLAEVKKAAAPAPKEVVVAKKDTMTPPKKAEAPKEEKKEVAPKEEKKEEKDEKKDVEPREEVDGGKPVKKTAKPTVKPTTPPKPTVPPTTKKPSEKKVVLDNKDLKTSPFSGSRMLSEVRGKVNPSSSSTRGKGKTEKPIEGPPGPPRGPRALAAVPEEKADPCHDGLSPRCTPPTSKPVEHHVKRSLAGSPTKSPSSGLHKPTWKPSSKPNEHRELQKDEKADPCHDGLSPRCTPPTSKPVEHRSLAGSPTKSPSSGLHKPTWKPSSKPAEHR